ncbi:MAG: outer membrane beta-barrel protein [Granulosicoccus sp.]
MKSTKLQKTILSAVLILALPAAQAGEWTGNFSGYLGQKSLNDNDWPQHDKQSSVGLLFDMKPANWPVSIAFDAFGTGDEDKSGLVKQEAYTAEGHLGIRKIFDLSGSLIRPYIGGGVAFVYAEEKDNSSGATRSDDDTGAGAWVGGGLYANLTTHFNLGLDVRYSGAETTVFGNDREAGGLNAGVSAGYHW